MAKIVEISEIEVAKHRARAAAARVSWAAFTARDTPLETEARQAFRTAVASYCDIVGIDRALWDGRLE